MSAKEIIEKEKKYIMQTYTRFPIVIDKGLDFWVFDKEGNKYLDFVGGLGTCSIGHANKDVAKAVSDQIRKLATVSNLYYMEPQIKLAEKLARESGLKKCFFCNSGAEANEAAIKLARKITKKTDIIATENAFHGRTFAALSATWKTKYKNEFEPLVPGFSHVPYNNVEAIKNAITEYTAAVIIEPIQGESGVVVPGKGYLKSVKEVCEKNGILLIADEVQTSLRTGKFFAYQHEKIKPDIATIAKGLANGIPIGVAISDLDFEKGDHASTFGGNSVSCAAALAALGFIKKNNLIEKANAKGGYFMKKLDGLKDNHSLIKDARGKGLMAALELKRDCKDIAERCMQKGILINYCSETVLRFLPPLTAGNKEIDKMIETLDNVLNELKFVIKVRK